MPVPSEGLSPQAEWFKYQGQTHTVAMANTALSYPPCSHRFAGNTEEARNPIRGQEWRLEILPNSSSQKPGTKPSSPSHQQLPTSLLTAPAPAAAMPRSCSLQISFTTVLCKVPGLMLMKKKQQTISEHFPPPSSRVRNSGLAVLLWGPREAAAFPGSAGSSSRNDQHRLQPAIKLPQV